jgi:hypothetical protein
VDGLNVRLIPFLRRKAPRECMRISSGMLTSSQLTIINWALNLLSIFSFNPLPVSIPERSA